MNAPDAAVTPRASSLCLGRGARVHEARRGDVAWRVVSGVVRYDAADAADGELTFSGLALKGDIVGAEALIFGHYAYRATALTPCVLEPWPGRHAPDSRSLLRSLAQAEKRAARIVALRSGQALARVSRLIGLLLPAPGQQRATAELPSLRDMAEITALTTETVSRAISDLRRRGALKPEKERRGGRNTSCLVAADLLPTA